MIEMRFRLFIRQHRNGNFTARVLNGPDAGSHEATRDEAIAAAERSLRRFLEYDDRANWGRFVFGECAELMQLPVEIFRKKSRDHDPIPLAVSLVITLEESRQGPRFVVTAPTIDGFQIVVRDASQIDARARRAVQRHVRGWPVALLLEADQDGVDSLEVLAIHLPGSDETDTTAEEELENTHDQDNVLGLCGVRLTSESALPRLSCAERREPLVQRLMTALAADRLSSVLLVGRNDVGKTALVHEVARRIQAGNCPEALKERELWHVTANNLIAGMKYTGEWQGRTQKLIQQARRGRQILYMGSPTEILDAGRWSGSDNNMGRFLQPYIQSGELVIVCEGSPESIAAEQRREAGFIQSFRRIDVAETDDADTLAIVNAVARRLEVEHPVRIEPEGVSAVCDLTRRFMPYRAFPGKAVGLLEELVRDVIADAEGAIRRIGRAETIAGFTRTTGLPAFILSDEVVLRETELRTYFEERLLGQPDAVDAMVDLITLVKAGLNDPQKPLGTFFFVGPTGVGKTEMAKVLAEFLFGSRDRMLRFDMSEYASADALSRLIGTAWRPDDDGELPRRVREQPFCVVLLDEVEKAAREVFDALLGVLGEGRLTDAGGRTADFRNAIIIMTSNLGAGRRELQSIGFGSHSADEGSAERLRSHFIREAEGFFRPEFFNRIDRLVLFQPLTPEAMRRITRRELGKLLMREGIVRRNMLVEIDDAVIDRLVAQGFHPLYGARSLQRELERAVIIPLARLLVEQRPDHRHLLRFSVRDGRIERSLVLLEGAADESTAEPPADRLQSTGGDIDLAELLGTLGRIRDRSADEESGGLVASLRAEMSALLARTHEPTFWDQGGQAREVLRRVYHLERVLKRFEALSERAERLEERTDRLRRTGVRAAPSGAVGTLAQEVERLAAEFSYLQVELAGAASGERHDQALIRVAPVGAQAGPWAARLARMYAAWANRKGYECRMLGTSATSGRRTAPPGPSAANLYVRGSNVYQFLRGEAGLHRLTQGTAEDRERHVARVSVILAPAELASAIAEGAGDLPAQLSQRLTELTSAADAGSGSESSPAVTRVYSLGRQRSIRDPHTGVRATHIEAVLDEGQIDAFLLARLRQNANIQP
jgi:ATP-dependent Clp protease ATP-binding subunit ClpA/protein subunit release factor B